MPYLGSSSVLFDSTSDSASSLFPNSHPSLPPTLTDRIPGELHDRIIDYFYANSRALAACALVCHAWLRASRYHFPTIEIRRQNVLQVRRLIDAPYSTLGRSGRRLALRASKVVHPEHFLGKTCTAVESLLLSTKYSVPAKELALWMGHCTHQLTELVLCVISIDSFVEFTSALHEFKVLQHLALVGVSWGEANLPVSLGSDEQLDFPLLPSLRSLVLQGYSISLVWWLLARDVGPITQVDLRLPNRLQALQYDPYLECFNISKCYCALASSLREIDLYPDRHCL